MGDSSTLTTLARSVSSESFVEDDNLIVIVNQIFKTTCDTKIAYIYWTAVESNLGSSNRGKADTFV